MSASKLDRIYRKSYFGFVYVWYDRIRKMLYVGSHMGSADRFEDAYICSQTRMRNVYSRRSSTFMRKIVYWHPTPDRKSLLAEEERWLKLAKKKGRKRVYNACFHVYEGPSHSQISKTYWENLTPEQYAVVCQQRSDARKKNWKDPAYHQRQVELAKERWKDPVYRNKIDTQKAWKASLEPSHSPEANAKRARAISGRRWYNDGSQEKSFREDPGMPWKPGRLGTAFSPEANAKRSKASKELYERDPEHPWKLGRLK